MNNKIVVGVLVAAALLLGWFAGHNNMFSAGAASGPSHYQTESFLQGHCDGTRDQSCWSNTGQMTLGASGTRVSNLISNTCNLTQLTPGSFAATTTQVFFCAMTGVLAGDKILIDMPAGAGINSGGAGSPQGGFIAVAGYATTTGIAVVEIANFTGAASSTFPQATTSIDIFDIR